MLSSSQSELSIRDEDIAAAIDEIKSRRSLIARVRAPGQILKQNTKSISSQQICGKSSESK